MAKRKLTPAQELREHVNRLAERYTHWEQERRDGCVDPPQSRTQSHNQFQAADSSHLRGVWANDTGDILPSSAASHAH